MQEQALSQRRYLLAPWERDTLDFTSRQRRGIRLGLLVSLLVHVLVLVITLRQNMESPSGMTSPEPTVVRLEPRPAPAKPVPKEIPKTKTAPRDRIIALAKPSSKGPRIPPQPPAPEVMPAEEPVPDPNAAPVDMMAMVNASRARRNALESVAARENADARASGRGPSENDIAMANINRNLQRGQGGGTGGVFEILSKGTRTAQFAFNGWTSTGVRGKWREVIEVDAGLGGDVELAIVRRMIELIRSHYTGDFNWDSHRLGRVVEMSARPQDTAALEAFMMREFFDVRDMARARPGR